MTQACETRPRVGAGRARECFSCVDNSLEYKASAPVPQPKLRAEREHATPFPRITGLIYGLT
jgi:hypothetical protein